MSRIKIKNFGPIKDGCLENDGWIDIKKVTAFIGNQGSGKSTVAKLISTFVWIEKALVRGSFDVKWFERRNRLKNQFLHYHRLETYIINSADGNKTTKIEYQGDAYHIKYVDSSLSITVNKNYKYPLPQIMYVPAERNFLSYVKSPKELKLSSESLQEFLTEFDNAKLTIESGISLPINNAKIQYDRLNDNLNIKGEDFRLRLSYASSGFQSIVPLFLVSRYLTNSVGQQSDNKETMSNEESGRFKNDFEKIWKDESLTDEQKRLALSVISSKFNKTAFINIVEEPEQNLFPTSQWELLKSLLEFNNDSPGNKLIMTTHSPYLINSLSIAIQAGYLKSKILSDNLLKKLNNIVPLKSIINADEVGIYQLDEIKGTISKLSDYEGIPSDENYLNQNLQEGNEMFDLLLEIEEEL